MNNGITINEYFKMMNDVVKIEDKKRSMMAALAEYNKISATFNGDVNSEECDRYLAASDKRFAAEKAYKTALTIFIKRYNTEKYSILTKDIRWYNVTHPTRMYELIRDRMMREGSHIEFSI